MQDGKEYIPDEEDIYGVNDIEEQEAFNRLLGIGQLTQEERMRRRKRIVIIIAVALLLSFGILLGFLELNPIRFK